MGEVIATKVSRVACVGCTEVASFSKHWPCLLPQHGPGKKHQRKIELAVWQQELVDQDPRPLIRGAAALRRLPGAELGERDAVPPLPLQQRVGGHPGIFGRACDQLGIEWRPNNRWSRSVARRGSVALLDELVGPKRRGRPGGRRRARAARPTADHRPCPV